MKVTIVGVGGLGGALADGLLDVAGIELCLCAKRLDPLEPFVGRATTSTDLTAAVDGADVVVLAVKPKDVVEVAARVASAAKAGALVVSCAAGISLARLDAAGAPTVALARAMPNIGARHGASTTGIVWGPRSEPVRDRGRLRRVFGAIGELLEVTDEERLHVVTAAAASGPAFVLMAVEALIDAGVEHGLTRAEALVCARGALNAAASCLTAGVEPLSVRAQVTSPGGTTAAGLSALEKGAVRHAFRDAVAAAVSRSRALG